MKLLQFYEKQDSAQTVYLGALRQDSTVCKLEQQGSMRDLIAKLAADPNLKSEIEQQLKNSGNTYSLDDVKLLSPITDPEKIICIGLNYRDHAAESNMELPKEPIMFPKYNNCIIGQDDAVVIPEEVKECDYEVELAFVVGKTAKHVSIENAMDYIFGYTVVNDVSSRDLQFSTSQWARGKTIDTFCPMGPWLVTADELPDPSNLNLHLTLNGEKVQNSNTQQLIFDIPYLLSFLSRTMTLQPGDIVSTGTPSGVIMGKKPQVWLKDGDVTEAFIEGIGTLRNTYVAEGK